MENILNSQSEIRSTLPETMTREDFSKKIAEETNMPLEKVLKMTSYPNNAIIDVATYWDPITQKIGLRRSSSLIEGLLAISDATNKSSKEILEALQISDDQFNAMVGVQETKKLCQDIKYVYEESQKLNDKIVSMRNSFSDEQLESEDDAQQFMPDFLQIQEYVENNLSSFEDLKDTRFAVRSILGEGGMILNAICGIKIIIAHKNRIKSIRDIVEDLTHIRNNFEGVYDNQRFQFLVK